MKKYWEECEYQEYLFQLCPVVRGAAIVVIK